MQIAASKQPGLQSRMSPAMNLDRCFAGLDFCNFQHFRAITGGNLIPGFCQADALSPCAACKIDDRFDTVQTEKFVEKNIEFFRLTAPVARNDRKPCIDTIVWLPEHCWINFLLPGNNWRLFVSPENMRQEMRQHD